MTTTSRRTTIIILAVCLLISVCINLFALGVFVALRSVDRPFASAAGAAMAIYPPSLREEIKQKLRAERTAVWAAVRELRDARRAMFGQMRADTLDREALERAMTDVRVKTTALQALLQSAVVETLEQAPALERKKIGPRGLGLGIFKRGF